MTEAEQRVILASDADRERSAGLLSDAVAEGRLTLEEFTERVESVQLARTEQDLAALVRDLPVARPPAAGVPAEAHHRAVCSSLERRGPWELAARSSFLSICGTIDLDLRQARLAGTDVLLDVRNWFGTVTVIVPDGVELSVEGGGLFASQVIDPPAAAPLPGAPRLRIRVSGPGGTLRVKSYEPHRLPAGPLVPPTT